MALLEVVAVLSRGYKRYQRQGQRTRADQPLKDLGFTAGEPSS